MQNFTTGLQWLSAIAYALLGVVAVVDWLRSRDRARGYLAMALGLLGVIILLSQVQQVMGTSYPRALSYLSSVSLIGSGYGLLLFRHHLIPYHRWVLIAVSAGAVAISVWALTVPQSNSGSSSAQVSPYLLLFAVVYLGYWCGMVAEPAYRLWRTSRRRPAVQRARLRLLAIGYMLIVAVFILLIGVIGALVGSGKATATTTIDPSIGLIFEVLFLVAAPVLYLSFRPPGWLRRSWRAREEEGYRNATRDLLLLSPDRASLAEKSLQWATRLVGADGAAIIEPGGSVLASEGLDPGIVATLATSPMDDDAQGSIKVRADLSAVVVPMPLEEGTARMVVVSGAFSPIFGGEEIDRLREYATSVTVALDRVALIDKLVLSEKELTLSERHLKEANAELEDRVQQRTRQLELSNADLSASNKELEAFSYSVSHDLRAPLRAIGGFAHILLEEHTSKLDDEAKDYLTDIATNAQDMGALIQDLLELSRLGRQQLSLQPVDPGDVARRALDKLALEMDGRTIEVEVGGMPGCEADPVLLQLVYQNLLANAIKFTRARPVAHVEVGAMPGETPAVYFVRDDGAGFDMAYNDQLFRVFERLHPHAEYEGTGVGLAIVQRVVARHGGRVWAEGEPGAGATFYFTLHGGASYEPR